MRTLTPAEVVAEAADWYDDNYPGWWTRVDLGLLEMGDSRHCIAGQLLVSKWEGVDGFHALWRGEFGAPPAVLAACAGPSSDDVDVPVVGTFDEHCDLLHDAWRDQIKRRFDEGRPA